MRKAIWVTVLAVLCCSVAWAQADKPIDGSLNPEKIPTSTVLFRLWLNHYTYEGKAHDVKHIGLPARDTDILADALERAIKIGSFHMDDDATYGNTATMWSHLQTKMSPGAFAKFQAYLENWKAGTKVSSLDWGLPFAVLRRQELVNGEPKLVPASAHMHGDPARQGPPGMQINYSFTSDTFWSQSTMVDDFSEDPNGGLNSNWAQANAHSGQNGIFQILNGQAYASGGAPAFSQAVPMPVNPAPGQGNEPHTCLGVVMGAVPNASGHYVGVAGGAIEEVTILPLRTHVWGFNGIRYVFTTAGVEIDRVTLNTNGTTTIQDIAYQNRTNTSGDAISACVEGGDGSTGQPQQVSVYLTPANGPTQRLWTLAQSYFNNPFEGTIPVYSGMIANGTATDATALNWWGFTGPALDASGTLAGNTICGPTQCSGVLHTPHVYNHDGTLNGDKQGAGVSPQTGINLQSTVLYPFDDQGCVDNVLDAGCPGNPPGPVISGVIICSAVGNFFNGGGSFDFETAVTLFENQGKVSGKVINAANYCRPASVPPDFGYAPMQIYNPFATAVPWLKLGAQCTRRHGKTGPQSWLCSWSVAPTEVPGLTVAAWSGLPDGNSADRYQCTLSDAGVAFQTNSNNSKTCDPKLNPGQPDHNPSGCWPPAWPGNPTIPSITWP